MACAITTCTVYVVFPFITWLLDERYFIHNYMYVICPALSFAMLYQARAVLSVAVKLQFPSNMLLTSR